MSNRTEKKNVRRKIGQNECTRIINFQTILFYGKSLILVWIFKIEMRLTRTLFHFLKVVQRRNGVSPFGVFHQRVAIFFGNA